MSDLPAPVIRPPEPPLAQTRVCANCHADLAGDYCARCGQRHEPHIHTVAHFAGEALESISHADSRLWRTLWYLFSRPGFLTREFFAGRRAAYLPPFRLYLVMSVLFFSLLGLGGGEPEDDVDRPAGAPDVAVLHGAADLIEQNARAEETQKAAAAASQVRELADRTAGAAPAITPAAEPDTPIDVMTGEGVNDGIERFCRDFRAGTANPETRTARQRGVLRWCRRYDDQGFSAVGKELLHNIPKAMFVLLPLLALCMKAIYWRPKRYYVEHLLFLVHNHTLVFLALASVMLVGMLPFVDDYVWLAYWAVTLYIAWYIYRGMRNVYGQGRALSLLKYFTLAVAYVAAGFAAFMLTLVYSAITF